MSTYDEVKFDVGDEDWDPVHTSATTPNKKPKVPKLRGPIPTATDEFPTKASPHKERDSLSLDSYEEMNEVPIVVQSRMSMPPDLPNIPPPLPPMRDIQDRPKVAKHVLSYIL